MRSSFHRELMKMEQHFLSTDTTLVVTSEAQSLTMNLELWMELQQLMGASFTG